MNKEIVPEAEYRHRIRMIARIMDYGTQLMAMGYEENLLFLWQKDLLKHNAVRAQLLKIFDSFTQKPNGYETELLHIYAKYDDLLKNCRNEKERKAIGVMGVMEINKLLDGGQVGLGGELSINKQTVMSQPINKEGK